MTRADRILVARAADRAWGAALTKQFGRAAGDARYDARGTSTPALKRLADAKLRADKAAGL